MHHATPATSGGLLLAAVLLAGCGAGTGGDAAGGGDDPGPTGTGAPTDATTTEDDVDQDQGTTGPTTGGTEPDVLLPSSPPLGAADLPADPAGAELTIVVGGPDAGGPVTLSCDWSAGTATGSHPDPERACADLLVALGAGNPFTPVAPDAMCTQVYGGDATAEVTGAVLDAEGGPVDVAGTFALTDGCEIDRWQRLGAVLSPYGGTT
ncbi:SSI family serine proteinase inhibitor [Jannaschia sp. R86511]|uniref:SSI family serine proteinase inhibitor n=1 Tax=Jannaschia sp. R86511 TaxID=3093853 RepID=UPI0036D33A1D